MMISLVPPGPIVIDASIAIWSILPIDAPIDTLHHFVTWRKNDIEIYAPSLWLAECVSAIRRTVFAGLITVAEGETAVADLLALEVEVVPISDAHCRAAYTWATGLGQSKAYDSFYLAAAESLQADFVTGDRRLVNGARQAGFTRVQWIGDVPGD